MLFGCQFIPNIIFKEAYSLNIKFDNAAYLL